MKTITSIIIFFAPFFSFASSTNYNKILFDYSSLDVFWTLTDKLSKSQTVDEDDWNKLMNSKAYSFFSDWGTLPSIKKNIILVFSPAKQNELDSFLKKEDFRSEFLKHLIAVKHNKNFLVNYEENLRMREQTITDSVLLLVQKWLPNELVSKNIEKPLVAFGVFGPEGYSGDYIVIDILQSKKMKLIEFIAHELHHYYVNKYKYLLKAKETEPAYDLLHCFSQLQIEGIADLIDKEIVFYNDGIGMPDILFRTYIKYYLFPIENLKQIDSLLSSKPTDSIKIREAGKIMRNLLPLAGHPHGFYMAKTIVKAFGERAILNTLKNPFDFFRLYNKAAAKSGVSYVFSHKTIEFINWLDRRFIIKK